MQNKDNLLKICNLLFSITDFDFGLFDQNLNSLCFLTHRNYPDSIFKFFTNFESQLLSHSENFSESCCFWQAVPELEFLYLTIRIQITSSEYYYVIIGPVLLLSYSDILIKTILKKANLPLSELENFSSVYKSIPLYQTKTKDLFLICYQLLTSISLVELPALLPEDSEVSKISTISAVSPQTSHSKADIQWNYEKEQLWRFAVSNGDIKNAKKIFSEMTNTDYLYCTPDDSLQTRKHILFSINTLCRAAAVDGGADFIAVQQKYTAFFILIKTFTNSSELELLIYRILETYCQLVSDSQNKNFSPLVKKAINYIHAHYDQTVTLHDTAENILCGKSHLSRCFHKETGKTFKSYLNEYRVQQAIFLLETELYRITDIAIMVGFSSYTKFSVAFKEVMGVCASDYLKEKI